MEVRTTEDDRPFPGHQRLLVERKAATGRQGLHAEDSARPHAPPTTDPRSLSPGSQAPVHRLLQDQVASVASRLGSDNVSHKFTFLSAQKILEYPGVKLPHFRAVNLDEHLGPMALVEMSISLAEVMADALRLKECVAVSHRWLQPMNPDPRGEQLRCLKRFLAANPSVKYVWLDWCSLPQNVWLQRTAEEEAHFRASLANLYLLFLGVRVLVVLDQQYSGRFWTVYEAWLAQRSIGGSDGLEAVLPSQSRVTFLPIMNSDEEDVEVFRKKWGKTTPQQAYARLSRDDIIVTNQSDKDMQLQVLATLPEFCKRMYRLVNDEHP